MKLSRNSAAAIAAIRVRPPDFALFMDWPIIAQPPMPPKHPVSALASPCAMRLAALRPGARRCRPQG